MQIIQKTNFNAFKDAIQLGPEKVIQLVKDSGLLGRGGASFPTGIDSELAQPENATVLGLLHYGLEDHGLPGRKKEEVERQQFKEAMEAQRLLEKLALEDEEKKKQEAMLKKEQQMKSTKSASGKCQGCGLKKCPKTCLFYNK